MELGNQIKSLRLSKGLTQEALAEQLGVTAQAVSKWERNAALPDIGMLPQLSVLFGVTIDQLFAIPDEDRLDRIQNMLWDERVLDPVLVEREKAFLLEKARREPENGRPHELLADMENHLADEHRALAAEYAREALRRDPVCKGAHDELVHAMGGKLADWCYTNHRELICWYQDFLENNPDNRGGYMWLLDQLIDDGRLEEASTWLERMAPVDAPSAHRCTGGLSPGPPGSGRRPWPSGNRCAGTGLRTGWCGTAWETPWPAPDSMARRRSTTESALSSSLRPDTRTCWNPLPRRGSWPGMCPVPSPHWRRRSPSWPMNGTPPPGKPWTRSAGRLTD